jgi:Cu+-exporting ATPase
METVFRIEGMHCGGCVTRVTRALQALADDVQVTLEPPQAVLESDAPVGLAEAQAAVAKAGAYVVTAT